MASDNNMHAHQATYTGFLALFRWGAVATALLTALVVWLLA